MNQYDLVAAQYEKLMGDVGDLPNSHLLNPLLTSLLPHDSHLHVLDVGCGNGRWTILLAKKYHTVIGIDKSEEMLEITRKKRHAANINYKQLDIEYDLPFAENSFDFIFSNMVMHYVKYIAKTAKELIRILKPNGELLFSTQHPLFTIARYTSLKDIHVRTEFKSKSLNGSAVLSRYHDPLDSFIAHFTNAGFILETQKDAIITEEFTKLYPSYANFIGLPRFVVLKFRKNPSVNIN